MIIELSVKSPCLWACFHPLSPLSVVFGKQGNFIKSQYEMLKLGINFIKSQYEMLKLGINFIKSQYEMLKLGINFIKSQYEMLKLGI
jgi:hypothetical protein